MFDSRHESPARDGWFAVTAGLVLQGRLDPKTACEPARTHVERLRERGSVTLVSVDDAPHFIAAFAPGCFARSVMAFAAGQPVAEQCAAE